jgi:GDP-L-fucose synthase
MEAGSSASDLPISTVHDIFDLETSHVLQAQIRLFDEALEANAPSVPLWGTDSPRREFVHVDDLADVCLFLMRHHEDPGLVNIEWRLAH